LKSGGQRRSSLLSGRDGIVIFHYPAPVIAPKREAGNAG